MSEGGKDNMVADANEEKTNGTPEKENDDEKTNENCDRNGTNQAVLMKQLEERCENLEKAQHQLESQLSTALRQKENAVKEKESMVIRYAVSEKNVLEQKRQREQFEKKYKETQRENDILQHKVQTTFSEKTRICNMLDSKCYELKSALQDLEKTKNELINTETKLKWSQSGLKTEVELHKECQQKLDQVNKTVQDSLNEAEKAKKSAQDSIKTYETSQENKAYTLEIQLKEHQANHILLKHERDDKDHQLKVLSEQLEKLNAKHKETLNENNELSQRILQLERDRLESQQKLSEIRTNRDREAEILVELHAKQTQIEQVRSQLDSEIEQSRNLREQFTLQKQTNDELSADMVVCRERESELLLFTQQLTDKNVRLQSEFTALETKVQQLSYEQAILKRSIKDLEQKNSSLTLRMNAERDQYNVEVEALKLELREKRELCETLNQKVVEHEGENAVIKRKFELTFREVNKELQSCRKKLENVDEQKSSSSSSSSTFSENSSSHNNVQVIQPETQIDRQTLIEHIVKLQRNSARKSEKIDFLEEHVNVLIGELQKKSQLLQSYVLRDQSGTLTSNAMDNNKAHIAKLNGIMASVYSSKVSDDKLTLELSLDINRKLQAVLEDALLKNIMLKENVDTLGKEIERLSERSQKL